jgi:rod shape-determining protein MreC
MRSLFKFVLRNHFFFLFLFLEGISFVLIIQQNAFQKSIFVSHTRNISAFVNKNLLGFREYLHLKDENNILSAENSRLRNLLEIYSDSLPDRITGKDTIKRISYQYIPARVINNSVNKQYNYILINKGKLQGVYNEMAVISDQGVVGIVSGISDHFATVLPVLNRNFRLSAKIKRNNYFGILEWDGLSPRRVLLKEIPVHVDVKQGDTVVTSGYSAIFPEDIHVGVIESVSPTDGNYHAIKVRLSTDYLNLVHVYLVRYYFKDEQENLTEGTTL